MAVPAFPVPPQIAPRGVNVHQARLHGLTVAVERVASWLTEVAASRGCGIAELDYVLLTDAELLELNREYLAHDTLTDVITFDTSEGTTAGTPLCKVSGECYISVERVRENATTFGVAGETELLRVMAHGLLHLCGLGDKTELERREMSAAEEDALGLLPADAPPVRFGTQA